MQLRNTSTTTLASIPTANNSSTPDLSTERPPLQRTKSQRYYASRRKSVKERRDQRSENGDTRSASYGSSGPAWHLILS
ncbi:hypothetical protein Slin15195_G035040 [Septoria linicola]|uniref:Uncharacterized protein n=1 Tax=Septoria linicola TaxID=215465 RepID=A0A9Q9APH0_9PEZI|nr:hypothetical protein Slin14017_G034060 [Septoria linicola]USW50185.1 hypothetical protein Slin15195_G035040 [Septoria linicola]